MRLFFSLWLYLFLGSPCLFGQFHVSSGATVTVSGNATLTLDDIDFDNQGTFTAGTGTVKFIGSADNTVHSGGAVFNNVELDKAADGDLRLLDNMDVNGTFTFVGNGNLIEVDNFNLVIGASGSMTGGNATNYVLTDSTGLLVKKDMSNFTYPVGADASTYNPLILVESGTQDTVGVRVMPNAKENGTAGAAFTDGVVDASWEVTEDVAGGSNIDMTAQWDGTDELTGFDRADSGIADYTASDWDLPFADAGNAAGSDPYTRNRTGLGAGIYAVSGEKLLNHVQLEARVFLQGAFETTDMRDDLRIGGHIPTAEPYATLVGFTHVGRGGGESVSSTAIFDQPGTSDDIVDWVMVELRDKNDSLSVLETQSALVQRDGDIVDVDGFSPVGIPVADDDYFVMIRHRNHLGVRTPAVLNLSEGSSTSYDFTTASSQADGTDPMAEPATGIFAMWGGNARTDDRYVRVTPRVFPPPSLNSDRTYILDVILAGNPNGTFTGYSTGDTNMDGYVRATPRVFPPPLLDSDATFILDDVLNGDPNGMKTEQ